MGYTIKDFFPGMIVNTSVFGRGVVKYVDEDLKLITVKFPSGYIKNYFEEDFHEIKGRVYNRSADKKTAWKFFVEVLFDTAKNAGILKSLLKGSFGDIKIEDIQPIEGFHTEFDLEGTYFGSGGNVKKESDSIIRLLKNKIKRVVKSDEFDINLVGIDIILERKGFAMFNKKKLSQVSEGDLRYVVNLAENRAEEREIDIEEALKEISEEYASGMRNHIKADPDEIYREALEAIQEGRFACNKVGGVPDIEKGMWVRSPFGEVVVKDFDKERGKAIVYSYNNDAYAEVDLQSLFPSSRADKKVRYFSNRSRRLKFAATKEEIVNRVIALSKRFLELRDLLNKAVDLEKDVRNIIYSVASARTGILYELESLQREYDQFKRGYSKTAQWGIDEDSLGREIEKLVSEWRSLDEEIKKKEKEVYDLSYDRDLVVQQIEDLGKSLSRIEGGFKMRDGLFSKKAEQSLEEFKTWVKELSEDELNSILNRKADEMLDTLNKIEEYERLLEELKERKKEMSKFFEGISSALGKEILKTESFIVKVKKWSQTKSRSWKEIATWIMERADEQLRKQAEAFAEKLKVVEERIRVDITPRSSSYSGMELSACRMVEDLVELGFTRKRVWAKVAKRFDKRLSKERLYDIVNDVYRNKEAQGLWERFKEYVKDLYHRGLDLVSSLSKWNREFEELLGKE